MSEALLYTTLLPLEIHLQEAKEKATSSVSEYVHHMWNEGVQSNIVCLMPETNKARLCKNVRGATKTRSCPVFCLN